MRTITAGRHARFANGVEINPSRARGRLDEHKHLRPAQREHVNRRGGPTEGPAIDNEQYLEWFFGRCRCECSVRSCTLLYMTQLSVSEARARLPEVLDRVADGDEVTITRHGQPVGVVVRPDTLRTRRAEATIGQARQVGDLLSTAGQQPLASASLSAERADELVRAVREARDRS